MTLGDIAIQIRFGYLTDFRSVRHSTHSTYFERYAAILCVRQLGARGFGVLRPPHFPPSLVVRSLPQASSQLYGANCLYGSIYDSG